MNSAITAGPNSNYGFGYDFNYALWTEGTVITLCNVPWNNDYRDVVKFADIPSLNAYIDGLTTTSTKIQNVSQIKPNTPIRLNLPFNAAYKYNYLRASSPVQPVNGDVQRDYFYFITDVKYIAPNTTEISIQIDVWQTFNNQVTFGNCYVERGHIGIANANAFNNYGRDYLTVPEGLDVGAEMQVIKTNSVPVMSQDLTGAFGDGAHAYDILVCATVDLLAAPGTKTAPNLQTSAGGNFFGLPSGANYYIFQGNTIGFQTYLQNTASAPWVTQSIISITVIPPVSRYIPGWTYPLSSATPKLAPTSVFQPIIYQMLSDWRNNTDILNNIPTRYQGLKKLFTYPYMAIELTTWTGTPLILKPESWADRDMTVVERIAPVPPNQRISVSPYKYNAKPGIATVPFVPGVPDAGLGDDQGEYLDLQTLITNFPTFAIVNNAALGYLAANTHSIAYQRQNASWAEQRALQSNAVGYDQASSAMTNANQQSSIQQAQMYGQNAIDQNLRANTMGLGIIGQVAGGLTGGPVGVGGGAAGGIMGALTASQQADAANQSVNLAAGTNSKSNRAAQQNMAYQRDTNKDLADWAAKGDYANSIAAVNARVQDANLIQPTTSGQVGGDAMNLFNNNAVISARVKMIDQASMALVCEYWLRFGYRIGRFLTPPPSLMVMSKFTYWKMQQTYITAATVPETYKQALRGMLEKGVTVWANPADIGNIDTATNAPLPGITI